MKKIPTVYLRDPDDRAHIIDEVNPGCEWVLAGEGIPTRKYDGTCTLLDDEGKWWARREVRQGKTPPEGWVMEHFDPVTGKAQGWEPIEQSAFYKFFREATLVGSFNPGTYELCGPKINGNPENYGEHKLIEHATAERVPEAHRHDPITTVIESGDCGWEGIVWHHPDGRMAKLKVRDLKTNVMYPNGPAKTVDDLAAVGPDGFPLFSAPDA